MNTFNEVSVEITSSTALRWCFSTSCSCIGGTPCVTFLCIRTSGHAAAFFTCGVQLWWAFTSTAWRPSSCLRTSELQTPTTNSKPARINLRTRKSAPIVDCSVGPGGPGPVPFSSFLANSVLNQIRSWDVYASVPDVHMCVVTVQFISSMLGAASSALAYTATCVLLRTYTLQYWWFNPLLSTLLKSSMKESDPRFCTRGYKSGTLFPKDAPRWNTLFDVHDFVLFLLEWAKYFWCDIPSWSIRHETIRCIVWLAILSKRTWSYQPYAFWSFVS